jgi:uncharacterized protein (DUF362 family)
MGRRTFLQAGAMGLAGAALATFVPNGKAAAQEKDKTSRLVVIKHADATDNEFVGKPDIVKHMVDRVVCELSGKDSVPDAWRTFIQPTDVVGMKVNAAGAGVIWTQPCVVAAIIQGLVAAGVDENNILVWDRSDSSLTDVGYKINDTKNGARCYGTDHARQISAAAEIHESNGVAVADKQVFFSKIVTNEITALINVPVVKDHVIAGITCAMKNHFGSIRNPKDLHPNGCDRYLGALNAAPPIKDKTRLIIVDGLTALFNGGPRGKAEWRWHLNCILASCDPVATDAWAQRTIEQKRAEKGLSAVGDRAKYIASAAQMGLGVDDLSRVDLIEKDLT